METKELIDLIAESAKLVRRQLTPGFEEKVYKNAMFIELRDNGLSVELKAVNALLPIHEVQLVNYLTATGIDDGMLINFGAERIEIRHRNRLYKSKPSHL